ALIACSGHGKGRYLARYPPTSHRCVTGVGSGPELAVEPLLGLLESAFVGTGGEVFPTGVGDDERDLCPLPFLFGPSCHTHGGVQGTSGGDPGEDALYVQEFPGAFECSIGGDGKAGGEHRLVVELRYETLVDVAQAVHEFTVTRFCGHDLYVRSVFTQVATRAHEGAGGTEHRDEVSDFRQIGTQLGTGGLVVGSGVGRITVLVEHRPVRVGSCHFLGDSDGLVGAARSIGEVDFGPPHGEQLLAVGGGVLRHHADRPVATVVGDHGQGG